MQARTQARTQAHRRRRTNLCLHAKTDMIHVHVATEEDVKKEDQCCMYCSLFVFPLVFSFSVIPCLY